MEKAIKLLAVSIIIGCLLLSASIIGKAYIEIFYNKYFITAEGARVMDKTTGNVYKVNSVEGYMTKIRMPN
jgi:hypothetical protein